MLQGGRQGCLLPGGRRGETDPKASFRRTLVPKGIWDHSSSFTGEQGGGKRASRHPSPSPESPRSRFPARISAEVTVPEALPAGSGQKAAPPEPGHQRGRGGRSGRPASHSRARPFPGLAPGAAKSFQPKSAAPARAANRPTQPPRRSGEPPARARPRCRDPRPRLPQPTPPPRSTYRRAGRRAAAGRAAAAAAAASGAAAGARPRGEKRGKVVLCRLRDTAEPAPGSAPFPTLPPARSPARPLRFPGTRRLRLWAAAAASAAEGRARASSTPSS